MGKNTNSPKASDKQGKNKANKVIKKTGEFWTPYSTEEPQFIFEEALLHKWLIQQGYRITNDYHVYRIHKGNIKRQDRKDIFSHVIKFVENQSISIKKPFRDKLMSCALKQCEDILINRIGMLLSLPKISIEQVGNGKEN